ncbi:SprT family zinc-dependent metalloprotease [Anaerospora sp.]|jgi:predicted metal-dependent hydrolase|uniref:M48 family metallopeptidase n=1 Tax=Anaerospora sp. TaxID=1960278 RepID=UPI00289D1BCB|nr:SprT family zinc-dependent metalloprotease [Anaerospora sp.]
MKTVTIYGSPIPYKIQRVKNRKTIQIAFTPERTLLVKAPYGITDLEAVTILTDKASWIHKHWHRLAKLSTNPVNSEFKSDALLLYLGQQYRLKLTTSSKDLVYIDGEHIIVQCSAASDTYPAFAQTLLLKWYVEQASSALLSRTNYWAKIIGVSPTRVTIRDQKTRWGSCSNRGSINYSWRLIMAPSTVMDYLVIHELCHMKVANHSQSFWQLVASYIIHYNEQRRWLKENGSILMRLFAPDK